MSSRRHKKTIPSDISQNVSTISRASSSESSRRTSVKNLTSTSAIHDNIDRFYQDILDNIINEDYLSELCKTSDLSTVKSLELKVDTSHQSIFEIHSLLPSLDALILDYSKISSVRDLGTGFQQIRHLSLFRCGLHDLDGIGVLVGIEELNVEDNFLTEVYPLAMHEKLKKLNLSGNKLSDLSFADTLSSCPNLKTLSLQRNPVSKVQNYRAIVCSIIPLIDRLDGVPVDHGASLKVTNAMILEAASAAASIAHSYTDSFDAEKISPNDYGSGDSNKVRSSSFGNNNLPDTGSELTHGSNVVLAGNVASAIRRRHGSKSESETASSTLAVFDDLLNGTSSLPDSDSTYFKEGDITNIEASGIESIIDFSSFDSVSVEPANMNKSPERRQTRRPSSTGHALKSGAPSGKGKSSSRIQINETESSITSSVRRPTSAAVIQSQIQPSSLISDDSADTIRSRLSSRSGFRSGPSDVDIPRNRSRQSSFISQSNNTRSIVHLDVVRRRGIAGEDCDILILDDDDASEGNGTSSSSNGSNGALVIAYGNDENDEDEDSEDDYQISHSARHRLMSSRGRRPTSSAPTSNSSVGSSIQVSQQTTHRGLPPTASIRDYYEIPSSRPSSARGGARPVSSGSSKRSDSATRESNSTLAGKSLGFDLYGSLAAIEQWAGTEDSDSDDIKPSLTSKQDTLASYSTLASNIANSADLCSTPDFPIDIKHSRGAPSKRSGRTHSVLLAPILPEKKEPAKDTPSILHRDKIITMFVKEDESVSTVRETAAKTSSEPENDSPQDRKSPGSRQTTHSSTIHAPNELPSIINTGYSPSRPTEPLGKKSTHRHLNSQPKEAFGEGVLLSDGELVSMLQRPPKTVLQLRTKTSFQAFFKGIDPQRMRNLLEAAYADVSNEIQRREKVNKRLELLCQ